MQFVMDCQLLRVLLDSSVRSAANGDKGTKEMLEEILMETFGSTAYSFGIPACVGNDSFEEI